MGLAGGAQAHNSCWGCASQCFTMGASVPSTTVGSSVTKGYTGFETLRKNKGQVSLLASTQLIPITQQHARRGAGLTAHVLGSFLWPRQGANSSQHAVELTPRSTSRVLRVDHHPATTGAGGGHNECT
eukprot:scaffold140391_cov21-Tisochrysis_lutea.AAC.1